MLFRSFNNMLAGITGNLYLVIKKSQDNPDVLKNLENIETLSLRAADMIRQLLDFARKGPVTMQERQLVPFIKKTIKLLQTSVPASITLHQEICTDELPVTADATQVHQILMNLLNNARDALDGIENPRITLRLKPFHPDEAFIQTHPYFSKNNYAHLSIEDNGCGIPEQELAHLFEPFFTTKAHGKGTGLGLAMVYGAVKTHKGFIEVDSTLGKGSTFHLYFPLHEAKIKTTGTARQSTLAEGLGELILLADDEQHVRETTAEVLEMQGYKVLQAKNGREAVDLFKEHQHSIATVLLDVVMPHMGGVEAAMCIKQFNPKIPVIFITGYDKEHIADHQEKIENCRVLTKPVCFDDLNQKIRSMLN